MTNHARLHLSLATISQWRHIGSAMDGLGKPTMGRVPQMGPVVSRAMHSKSCAKALGRLARDAPH